MYNLHVDDEVLERFKQEDAQFSNSLIIHQVKTKKITTVKEGWIPGLKVTSHLRGFPLEKKIVRAPVSIKSLQTIYQKKA